MTGQGAPRYYRFLQVLAHFLLRFSFSYRSRGGRQIPLSGGVILASNHQAWMDPILLGAFCPRPLRFLARRTLFYWPLGPLIRALGAYPIDREGDQREALRRTLELLAAEQVVVIFAEGTRTRDGRLQPLRAGAAMLAARARVPIVPAYIGGAFAAWPKGTYLPRLTGPITVFYGQPIPVGPQPEGLSSHDYYQQIQGRLAAALADLERCYQEECAARDRRRDEPP